MHTHSLSIHSDSGRTLRSWELALLLAVCVTLLTGTWAQARSALLASRLVRLHVIAVSDDDTEQAVKLQVRDAVLAYLEPQLAGVTDVDTARLRIADDLDGIARAAQTAAGERPVRVTLGAEHYPTRDYGTFALPAGVYTSLRVTLGAGAGLCFRPVRRRPYAYSTLMVFVLPLRPLMMPPVMMTLSPFSSCMTARLTFSAW